MSYPYDEANETLARHHLRNHLGEDADPKLIVALSEELQKCIETFMENMEE